MKTFTIKLMATVFMMVVLLGAANAQYLADRLLFSTRLTGAAQVPAVNTDANGFAVFMLNSTRDTMQVVVSTAMAGKIEKLRIYRGAAGTNGSMVLNLDSKVQGNVARTVIFGATLQGLMKDFLMGNLYVNVHTNTHPNGMIRGQVKLEADMHFKAWLDNDQAGTSSDGYGLGSFTVSLAEDSLIVRLVTDSLSGDISSAHFHYGKAGQTGNVAIDFSSTIHGKHLRGGVSISSAIRDNLIEALLSDSIYVNVHTVQEPNGEIRGQVRKTSQLAFDAALDQDELIAGGGVPIASSDGYGVAVVYLNHTFDTVFYDAMVADLTGAIQAAYFYQGTSTTMGSSVKTVSSNGVRISGYWSLSDANQPLTNAYISQMMYGNIHLTVHTFANLISGEIRGNMMRTAREGLIGELDSSQSGVSTRASGAIMASYDRYRSNVHYMTAFEGLKGNITKVEFHKAVWGETGPKIHDLDVPSLGGLYGYWNSSNGFTMDNAIALSTNDSVYINVYSDSFPNGELRGQMVRNYHISSETQQQLDVKQIKAQLNRITMYPNPANTVVTMAVSSKAAFAGTVIFYDIQGRELLQRDIAVVPGENQLPVDISSLNEGIYLVKLQLNGETAAVTRISKN